MTNRVVTSPAGQEVLVFDDEEWADVLGVEVGSRSWGQAMQKGPRLAVLAVLWRDGPVEDPSGFASSVLLDLATELDEGVPLSLARLLGGSSTLRSCVERETKGRRTYSIRLVALPERWLPDVERLARRRTRSTVPTSIQTRSATAGAGDPRQFPAPVSAPLPSQPAQVAPGATPVTSGGALPSAAPPDQEAALGPPGRPLAQDVASAVATALLAQVVEVLAKGPAGPQEAQLRRDLEAMAERLGTQVDYVDKLRRDLRATGDEVLALRQERDGLRERLRRTEANLKAATSQDAQRIIDAEVRRQLDRMMREKPTARSAIDADLEALAEVTR